MMGGLTDTFKPYIVLSKRSATSLEIIANAMRMRAGGFDFV